MLRVGITGGIGSGKTTVCQVFATLGIPVFHADDAAKKLMLEDDALKQRIIFLLGEGAYKEGRPDNAYISSIVFSQPEKLAALNALVHPVTIDYAARWFATQAGKAPYAIKEAAIFFESGSDKYVDVMIGIYAPKALRIARAAQRSNLPPADIKARIARQMDEEEKMARCQYVITNDDTQAVLPQVLKIHEQLLGR